MTATMTDAAAKALRAPFPAEAIGKLPKGGTQLDYVGHAAVTSRLLEVDPAWTWEPVAFNAEGAPLVSFRDKEATMWIRLTICGITRLGVGIAPASAFELEKQLISDAIRNAAMRFGVALDLWSKSDLGHQRDGAPQPAPTGPRPAPKARIDALRARIDTCDEPGLMKEWIRDQGFEWPWTPESCTAIERELDGLEQGDPF